MEELEKEGNSAQGIIKLASDPNILAAILDDDNITQNEQNNETFSDNTTENTLKMNQENNGVVMDDSGDVIVNNEDEFLADSLDLKDNEVSESDNTERSFQLQEERSDDITENGSSVTTESITKSTDSSTLSSKDVKQKYSDNNSVNPQGKPKPKVKPFFIDKNKENFSRKPGKSSYAAMYSQKLKLKQGKTNQNQGKAGNPREKENEESKRESMEEYDQFNVSSSSFSSELSNTSTTYTNFDKSGYYNVLDYSTQSPFANPNPSVIPNYESYVTLPYNAPYRDFGLRYSNYGHQSYQTSSAMSNPQSNVMVPVAQFQGYASQSAPPGVVYQRRPLIDQVEFFPEHDYILSQSLTNSQFINPAHLYQRNSNLERKFMSEPQLSNSHLLSTDKDRASKLSDGNRSHESSLQKPVDYKPYTLKEYRQIKNEQLDMLGSLGPDTESDGYKEKVG